MHIILFEDHLRSNFLPLVFTRPIGALRYGIRTLTEQWSSLFINATVCHKTEPYLSEIFPCDVLEVNVVINARLIPSATIQQKVSDLKEHEALVSNGILVAMCGPKSSITDWMETGIIPSAFKQMEVEVTMLTHLTQLFAWNEQAIASEFTQLTRGRTSAPLSETVTVIGKSDLIFVEEGASVEGCWLNTKNGPIHIGKDAQVMEGSVVYGPFALGEHATVKAGSKIYGATTIGPHCKVGGEISNSVMLGYSNKGHDGFLGNSILGEWCNIGADTNTSNLKNNYSDVRIWSYNEGSYPSTGLTFCGLIMGDHSKCGINTMFNTGTVVGVNANIFDSGFPPKFIASFSWGGSAGFVTYEFHKAMEVAEKVMARRNVTLSAAEQKMLKHIFDTTARYRV